MLVYYWLVVVFVLGAIVGSFLNVVIARLPLEKSIIWPGSRCGRCVRPGSPGNPVGHYSARSNNRSDRSGAAAVALALDAGRGSDGAQRHPPCRCVDDSRINQGGCLRLAGLGTLAGRAGAGREL